MKQFKYIHVIAALFLLLGMGVQSYVSYSRAQSQLQEKMDLEMQIAQEKLRFELYDALEAWAELEDQVKKHLHEPETIILKTDEILRRYPNFYACYVAFPPYYLPQQKWFEPTTYRTQDTIISCILGDAEHDYFEREWYKGASQSVDDYWSPPYREETFNKTIYSYAKSLRDEEGNLICIIGVDFSLKWINRLLEQFKPFEEAVFMLYSSNDQLLAASDGAPAEGFDQTWIITRKTLQPIHINMVTAIPKSHILKSLRLGILLPLGVFVLGILVVGFLIHRITRDEQVNARLKTEKEVMSHELEIAHDIQMGILKDEKEKKQAQGKGDIDLQTLLVPMREVGGDLFDYHREGDELWFIIGDVSGKGVPAAMFMSAAVNLFRAAGARASSPKQIMEEMNAVLSENNPSMTFVTAFVGRLRIPTGELIYCNAGHCLPIKVQSDKGQSTIDTLPIEPNIPLGYKGDYSFVEQGCMLGQGETLVLYTDGVTEARNSARAMLGLERWKKIVATQEDLYGAIQAFMGKAEPTDDITLMTLRKTRAVEPLILRVENRMERWPQMRAALHDHGMCAGMEKRALKKTEIAIEEAVVNIVNYSQAEWMEIEVKGERLKVKGLEIILRDNGVAFDPTQQAEVDTERATAERQVGGLGIALLRKIADEVRYSREDDINTLTIIKNI